MIPIPVATVAPSLRQFRFPASLPLLLGRPPSCHPVKRKEFNPQLFIKRMLENMIERSKLVFFLRQRKRPPHAISSNPIPCETTIPLLSSLAVIRYWCPLTREFINSKKKNIINGLIFLQYSLRIQQRRASVKDSYFARRIYLTI